MKIVERKRKKRKVRMGLVRRYRAGDLEALKT
jgi:hypothetical protein